MALTVEEQAELSKLEKLVARRVRSGGQETEFDPEAVQRRITELRAKADDPPPTRRLVRFSKGTR